ncbi:putative neuropeptide Y receptor type 2-like [Apostichopus japonicus]|uniref:Putative neuropeptide Y receptor type 2-like n=1 Tax=Stichopus japonicus TaxID=307972 RepID=A0A2G8JEB1_STIJA|nr:putative neuropeptide Y receptor type 2-like [Apostichopus japonicus]
MEGLLYTSIDSQEYEETTSLGNETGGIPECKLITFHPQHAREGSYEIFHRYIYNPILLPDDSSDHCAREHRLEVKDQRQAWCQTEGHRTERKLSSSKDEPDVVGVVIVFASCWLPLNLYEILFEYRIISPQELCITPFVLFLPSVCSTFLNPLLYAWLNDNFRKEFYKLLPFLTVLGESSFKTSAGPTGSHASGAFSNFKRPRTTLGSYLQPTTAESTVLKTTPKPQRKGFEDTKI